MFQTHSSNKALPQQNEDIIQQVKRKGNILLIKICNILTCAIILLILHQITFELSQISENKAKLISRIIMAISTHIVKKTIQTYPFTAEYATLLLMTIVNLNMFERGVKLSPENFKLSETMYGVVTLTELLYTTVLPRRRLKTFYNLFVQSYIFIRIYQQYGHISSEMSATLVLTVFFGDLSSQNIEYILESMRDLYIAQQKSYAENFKRTLEIIPQGILVINKHDQQIVYANEEVWQVVGEQYQVLDSSQCFETIKKSLKTFVFQEKYTNNNHNQSQNAKSSHSEPQNQQKYKHNLWKCLVKQNIVSHFNQTSEFIFKKTNPKQYLQVRASIINNGEQIIAIMNNITKIKELESVSQKIRSMFFSSIAHELRTPLNSIIPLTRILQDTITDPKALKYLKIIVNSSLHLQNLIEDSLDMSRIENNKFEVNLEFYDLHQSIMEVAQIMEFPIEQKGIKLLLDIKDNVPQEIHSDAKRYRQILFNLIGNAVKFTFKGHIKINVDFQNDYLTTSVEDTGIGIKEEEMSKLFQFFGQVSHSKKINKSGMGLGLTISKLIVQELNGDIKVDSVFGQGTTFTFSIKVSGHRHRSSQNSIELLPIEEDQNLLSQESIVQQVNSNPILLQPIMRNNNTLQSKSRNPYVLLDENILQHEAEFEDENDLLSNKYQQFQTQLSLGHASAFNFDFSQVPQQQQPSQSQSILIVDDSPYNLFVMREILMTISEQIQIQTAQHGQEAIEKILDLNNLIERQSKFDFIFMDLHMPILDGFQAVKKLKELEQDGILNLSNTQLIALSAITQNQFTRTKDHQLFNSFLEKPVNVNALKNLFNNNL